MQAIRRLGLPVLALIMLVGVVAGPWLVSPATAEPAGRTFFVSKQGNNADGASWATAWNELSRINWAVVEPGDLILIDGGATPCPRLGPGYNCGMVYNSTLSVQKSGLPGFPIVIQLAAEPGRNGTAIIDGGITRWSRCAEYTEEPRPPATPNGAGERQIGVDFEIAQWVVLDGTHWGGIEIRNHTRFGLSYDSSQYITARYLKIHHNTDPNDASNGAGGVNQSYLSANNTLARSEIFRNGQDAIRGGGDYFTLEESFLHDHYCNHADGIQSYVPTANPDVPDEAGEVVGLVVRRNIFDSLGTQALMLGENDKHQSWNRDVVITDNWFLNGPYMIKSKNGLSTNWTISRNTFVNVSELAIEWCCAVPGAQAPMAVVDNVFVNVNQGRNAMYLPTGNGDTWFANNCVHRTGVVSGNVLQSGTVTADPRLSDPSGGSYSLASSSPCAERGSSLVSLCQLIGATPTPPSLAVPPAGRFRLRLPALLMNRVRTSALRCN